MSDEKRNEEQADRLGDMNGDAQRGGRTPDPQADAGKEPRPADKDAHDAIPSRSFNL